MQVNLFQLLDSILPLSLQPVTLALQRCLLGLPLVLACFCLHRRGARKAIQAGGTHA